jgi:hypothetical protein
MPLAAIKRIHKCIGHIVPLETTTPSSKSRSRHQAMAVRGRRTVEIVTPSGNAARGDGVRQVGNRLISRADRGSSSRGLGVAHDHFSTGGETGTWKHSGTAAMTSMLGGYRSRRSAPRQGSDPIAPAGADVTGVNRIRAKRTGQQADRRRRQT